VNYTNGIYKKMRAPKNREKKINFRGVPAVLFVEMNLMETQLRDANFDKLIEDSEYLLSANVLHEFTNFKQQLLLVV
jgi:hypothetical protein